MQSAETDEFNTQIRVMLDVMLQVIGGRPVSNDAWELIAAQYGTENRIYHLLEHVRDFAAGMSPYSPYRPQEDIAAVGHDVIYIKVDEKVSDPAAAMLSKYVLVNGESRTDGKAYTPDATYTIRTPDSPEAKRVAEIVYTLFGVDGKADKQGQEAELPPLNDKGAVKGGPFLNEFLSALIWTDILQESKCKPLDMVIDAAIIEHTIPFRGEECLHNLENRLEALNNKLGLGLDAAKMQEVMVSVVACGNSDVYAFIGGPPHANMTYEQRFLKHAQATWELIPENNLRFQGDKRDYTPTEFRQQLQSAHNFEIGVLGDKSVFHQYSGYPSDEEFGRLKELEQQIRQDTGRYLRAKIVSAALVEAIAAQSGAGDLHLSTIMGVDSIQMPETGNGEHVSTNVVLHTLKEGRDDNPGFDTTKSPIAAYLLETMGPEKIETLYAKVQQHFTAKEKSGGNPEYAQFLEEVVALGGKGRANEYKNPVYRTAGAIAQVARDNDRPQLARRITDTVVSLQQEQVRGLG